MNNTCASFVGRGLAYIFYKSLKIVLLSVLLVIY